MRELLLPWDQQPQVATYLNERFAGDTIIYAVASHGGYQLSGRPLTAYNGAAAVPTQAGMAWDLSSSNAYVDLGVVPETPDGLAYVCIAKQGSDANNFIFSTRTGSTNGFELLCGATVGTAATRRTGNTASPFATGLNDGRFHAYAGSWDRFGTSIAVDGVYIGAGGSSTAFPHAQNCFIGRRATTYFSGQVAALAIVLRPMPRSEQEDVTYDLLAMYNEMLVHRRIFIPSASVSGSGTGALPIVGRGPGMALAGNGGGLAGHWGTA